MDSPLPPRAQDSWDSMLPGPPNRSNSASSDVSTGGLLAYGSGSSVAVVDPRSMQLVSVLPMPAPSASSPLAPFVTSVRWAPLHLAVADDPSSVLRLAVGDRQGRIALWDFRSRKILRWLDLDLGSKLGIQDLCWIRSETWLLASIHGPSMISLWNLTSGRCIWKYDASPEYLSFIRRDPFDSRHFCVIGLRGFLLSAIVLGDGVGDVSIQEHHILNSGGGELEKLEKEKDLSSSSASANVSPASALFPMFFVRFCFSPRWRHILTVVFPKELIVFDLQYGTALWSTSLPRGCSKFMDIMLDLDLDLLYCVHLDGKLSIWKRKE